jgi:transposase-like protein
VTKLTLEEERMARKEDDKDLLSIWQEATGQGDDGLRRVMEVAIQRILEEELTSFLQAETHERTQDRKGYRNGYKPRTLTTRLGRMDLLIPKDREGRFQTELFERYQRNEKALMLSLVEMYVHGVSTRKVKAVTEALCGLDISRSQVSRLAKDLDEEVQTWRNRPLKKPYPYLVVDARYEKIRINHQVLPQGVLLVVGIGEDGYREILGTWVADSESEASWSEVFKDLKERGLAGVRYVVSDDHAGLVKAIGRHFQGCLWQRCQVHFLRNIISQVSKKDRSRIIEMIRDITAAQSYEIARKRMDDVIESSEKTHPKVSQMLEEHGEEILSVYQLPLHHRRSMKSTNMLERYNQELKRRTRVVRIFPHQESCLRLVTAMAMEMSEEWMIRRYLIFEDEVSGKTTKELLAA